MNQSFRIDTVPILRTTELPDGRLRIYSRIGKYDQPLTYRNPDGSKRVEIIRKDALYSDRTLDSFKSLSVTLGHPPVALNDSNSVTFTKGFTGENLIKEEPYLGVISTIIDKTTKQAILSRKASQTSPGYLTQLGRGDGSDNDPYEQLYRDANHLAAVALGRHGSDVDFRIDAQDDSELWFSNADPDIYRADCDTEFLSSILNKLDLDEQTFVKTAFNLSPYLNKDEVKMPTTSIPLGKKIYNIDGEQSVELAGKVEELLTRIDALETDKAKVETELSTVKAELETTKTEASRTDALLEVTKEKLTAAEALPKFNADEQATEMATQMSERIGLWSAVLPVLRADGASFEPDFKLDSVNIQRLYLLSQKPELAENKRFNSDSGYVEGLYAALQPSEVKTDESTDSEDRKDEQENISNSLLEMISKAREDSANTVEGERADGGMYGGANYSGGAGDKKDPIAERRAKRSKMPVNAKESV